MRNALHSIARTSDLGVTLNANGYIWRSISRLWTNNLVRVSLLGMRFLILSYERAYTRKVRVIIAISCSEQAFPSFKSSQMAITITPRVVRLC